MLVELTVLALLVAEPSSRWHPGGNFTPLLGDAVYRREAGVTEPNAFHFGVRPEVFFFRERLGLGAFAELSSTAGRDLVGLVGPTVTLQVGSHPNATLSASEVAMTLSPRVIIRSALQASVGISVGLAARWLNSFGVGVEGRFGFGPGAERAVITSAQIGVKVIGALLFALAWGKGPT